MISRALPDGLNIALLSLVVLTGILCPGCGGKAYIAGQQQFHSSVLPAGITVAPLALYYSEAGSGTAYDQLGVKAIRLSITSGGLTLMERQYSIYGECVEWYPEWLPDGTLTVIFYDAAGGNSTTSPSGLLAKGSRVLARFCFVYDGLARSYNEAALSDAEVAKVMSRHLGKDVKIPVIDPDREPPPAPK